MDSNKGQPIIILHDLLPILKKHGQCKPNMYSASKIEASYRRLKTAKKKLTSRKYQTSSSKSKLSIPPASEENDASRKERNVPVASANASSSSSTDSGYSDRSTKKKKRLPHALIQSTDKWPIIILHDLLPILKKHGECKPNMYSASKIEASYRRLKAAKKKLTSRKHQTSSKSKSIPPTASEENDASRKERKMPVTTTNRSSSTDSGKSSKKKKGLPHWRQLRLEPEVLKRIKLRALAELQEEYRQKYISNHQTPLNSTASSTLSKHKSSGQEKSINNCFRPETLTVENSNEFSSKTSSDNSTGATPPDEEMLYLTPEKDKYVGNQVNLTAYPSTTDLQNSSDAQNSDNKSPEKTCDKITTTNTVVPTLTLPTPLQLHTEDGNNSDLKHEDNDEDQHQQQTEENNNDAEDKGGIVDDTNDVDNLFIVVRRHNPNK